MLPVFDPDFFCACNVDSCFSDAAETADAYLYPLLFVNLAKPFDYLVICPIIKIRNLNQIIFAHVLNFNWLKAYLRRGKSSAMLWSQG